MDATRKQLKDDVLEALNEVRRRASVAINYDLDNAPKGSVIYGEYQYVEDVTYLLIESLKRLTV